MGKIDLFTILLDKPNAVYYAGEVITGKLVIYVKEQLKVNSVKMFVSGVARVSWTETYSQNNQTKVNHFSSREEYLNFNIVFLSKNKSDDLYLEVNDYTFPFEIKLPENLPTSFEHEYGRLRYALDGTIDIPWAFDKHVKLSFTVISPLDLNTNTFLRQSYNTSETRKLGCLCCKTDPITVHFSLMKTGYVPGEGIVFNAVIDNKSSRSIKDVKVKLFQSITLNTPTKSRTCFREVAAIYLNKVIEPKGIEDWKGSVLTIPAVSATSNPICRIIVVSYFVRFSLDPSGPTRDFEIVVPITIGTVPLQTGSETKSSQVFQPALFPISNDEELDEKPKGEIINMDLAYSPSYPYYKDLRTQN